MIHCITCYSDRLFSARQIDQPSTLTPAPSSLSWLFACSSTSKKADCKYVFQFVTFKPCLLTFRSMQPCHLLIALVLIRVHALNTHDTLHIRDVSAHLASVSQLPKFIIRIHDIFPSGTGSALAHNDPRGCRSSTVGWSSSPVVAASNMLAKLDSLGCPA